MSYWLSFQSARVSFGRLALCLVAIATLGAAERPNVVLILCDNLGYGDVGCYGSRLHRTPNIDRLAAEGTRFTHCYAASGVCTPSRAALMTGSYPIRVGLHLSDTGGAVLQPVSPKGLHADEYTLAESLRDAGYRTACIGKWHLGDQPEFLPTRHGFDYYFGIPYSDDMTPRAGQIWPPLPLMRDERVIEAPVDRNELTRRYTLETIELMRRHRDEPFFVLLAHAMPGSTPHPYASEAFRGRSQNGPWGDSVEEIDWSTGEILGALGELGLDDRTLVIFTNDNGAPRREPVQGSNLPLRGWGYSTDEGGMRVPFIARLPGRVPAGRQCDALMSLMDMLPTLARLTGASLARDRTIDGRDIAPLLLGNSDESPHEVFYYYQGEQLQAVRDRRWKLYLPLDEKRGLGRQRLRAELRLFDLRHDPNESRDVAADHGDVVQRLMAHADRARRELGDVGVVGHGVRAAGRVESPTPRVLD